VEVVEGEDFSDWGLEVEAVVDVAASAEFFEDYLVSLGAEK